MRLYLYQGIEDEIPMLERYKIVHVLVLEHVVKIRKSAFEHCHNLISVTMFDNVVDIEDYAFDNCDKMRYIKLSKGLQTIGRYAFNKCNAMRAYAIPSSVRKVKTRAFWNNNSLRFLNLPRNLEPDLTKTAICTKTAKRVNSDLFWRVQRVEGMLGGRHGNDYLDNFLLSRNPEYYSDKGVLNSWLCFHMEDYGLHNMCFNPSIEVEELNEYVGRNAASVRQIEHFNMTSPLHMLAMNPHAPDSAFEVLFELWNSAVFKKDILKRTPIEIAEIYNLPGMMTLIRCLCLHRVGTIGFVPPTPNPYRERLRKRSRIRYN